MWTNESLISIISSRVQKQHWKHQFFAHSIHSLVAKLLTTSNLFHETTAKTFSNFYPIRVQSVQKPNRWDIAIVIIDVVVVLCVGGDGGNKHKSKSHPLLIIIVWGALNVSGIANFDYCRTTFAHTNTQCKSHSTHNDFPQWQSPYNHKTIRWQWKRLTATNEMEKKSTCNKIYLKNQQTKDMKR